MLLIIGGSKDPNIERLAGAAAARGYPHRVFHTDATPAPVIIQQSGCPDITINGENFSPRETSLFIRFDVFGDTDTKTAHTLLNTVNGWARQHSAVKILNRNNISPSVSKPRALIIAKECGFDIPKTWVTADFNSFAARDQFIAKPVSGGDYTKLLSDMPIQADRPYIVQEKLEYPELRLFYAGGYYFAFTIQCPDLDYRISDDVTMVETKPPAHLVSAMEKLTDQMGLDYAACDFKTDPRTGKLLFLEINTLPMFSGYDTVAQGRLSDAIFLSLQQKLPAPKISNYPTL